MARKALLTVVLVRAVLAQNSHPSASEYRGVTEPSPTVVRKLAEPASLAPDDPVLSIRGVCHEAENEAFTAGDCTLTISRQQFEDLMSILSPERQLTPEMKRHLAKTYTELLAFDSAARELGLDQSPQYQTKMRWLEGKTLEDLLRRRLEKESGTVSEAEIDVYFREELPRFEEVRLRRLVLPKSNLTLGAPQKVGLDAQRIAVELRERAAHGEDMEQLQREGYQALGFGGLPPATDIGTRRKANLPSEAREEVFSLRPGDVSKVENETYSFVIYKVEAKSRPSREQVKDEIIREIAKEKLERALKTVTGQFPAELNKKYFGTASAQ